MQLGVGTVKFLIADLHYCSLLGSTPIHLPHPQNYCCCLLHSFCLTAYPSLPPQVLLGCCCPLGPHFIPKLTCGSCSTGVEPRVAPSAKGARMMYAFIHAASPRTVGVKSDFGFRTQQRLILWVLARKMYSGQMRCSNGFSRSMLCICRYITGPSPLCCNCCFQS